MTLVLWRGWEFTHRVLAAYQLSLDGDFLGASSEACAVAVGVAAVGSMKLADRFVDQRAAEDITIRIVSVV